MAEHQGTPIQQFLATVRQQLIRIHRQETLIEFLEKAFYYLGLAVIAVAVFIALDAWFQFPPAIRMVFTTILGILLFGVLSIYGWQFLVRSVTIRDDYLRDVAIDLGQQFPDVGDALVDFLDLYHQTVPEAQEHFRMASLRQLQQIIPLERLQQFSPFQQARAMGRRVMAFSAVLLVLFFTFPGAIKIGLMRVLYPGEDLHRPLPFTLKNVTGDVQVLKNDPVTLTCQISGVVPDELKLIIQTVTDSAGTVQHNEVPLAVNGNNQYQYTIPHVQRDFQFWFEGALNAVQFKGRVGRSSVGTVSVISRPMVREIRLKYLPPAYTQEEPRWLDPNTGNVTVLSGSRLSLSVLADRILQEAWVQLQDSTRIPLQVRGREAFGEWQVQQSVEYQIYVKDLNGALNFQPVTYSLVVIPDAAPQVEILVPGADVDLGEELSVPIKMEATDDYGFSRMWLKGRIIRAGSSGDTVQFQQPVPFKVVASGRAVSMIEWNLADLYLIPDDYIEYFAEVWDNNTVTGPSVGRSRTYVIRLPSLIDLMEESSESLAEAQDEMEQSLETTHEIRKKLEEINRDLKRDKRLSWEQQKEVEQQLQRHQEVQEKLQEVQRQLQETIEQLDKNAMLSPDVLEKYFELQEMLQKLMPPELQKIMQELQQALQQMNPQKIQQAMQRLQASLQEFEQQIERTYELFKQVEMERRLDELTRMAQRLAEEQQKLTEELERAARENAPPPQELLSQQANIQREYDFLQDKLQQAEQFFQENRATTAEKLNRVQQFSKQRAIEQKMERTSQQMAQGQTQQAQSSSEQTASDLQSMQQMLQEARQEMVQAQKNQLMRGMQKVTRDLLEASFTQEAIMRDTRRLSYASPLMRQVARREANLRENLQATTRQIIELSHQTFFISPRMNQLLQQMYQNMERALREMEERNPRSAANYQQKAMAAMNQAILTMQSAMKQLGQSSSATGFEEFMKQMEQMAQAQGQVNQQTLSLFQQMQQGRLQLSKDALARLAAQQEMIRRSLQQLQEQQGYRRDVAGRLDGIAREMEEVVRELQRKQLDRRVIERQQQILSRLLEAQKSIRERDQSKKRQAEWEKAPIVRSPGAINWQTLQQPDQLRREMLRSLEEGYSLEYQRFIKQYYDALFEAASKTKNKN